MKQQRTADILLTHTLHQKVINMALEKINYHFKEVKRNHVYLIFLVVLLEKRNSRVTLYHLMELGKELDFKLGDRIGYAKLIKELEQAKYVQQYGDRVEMKHTKAYRTTNLVKLLFRYIIKDYARLIEEYE